MEFQERAILRQSDDVFDVVPRLGGAAVHHILNIYPEIWHTRLRREVPVDEFKFLEAFHQSGLDHFIAAVTESDTSLPVTYRDLRR